MILFKSSQRFQSKLFQFLNMKIPFPMIAFSLTKKSQNEGVMLPDTVSALYRHLIFSL